jgi:hypothetical protein
VKENILNKKANTAHNSIVDAIHIHESGIFLGEPESFIFSPDTLIIGKKERLY